MVHVRASKQFGSRRDVWRLSVCPIARVVVLTVIAGVTLCSCGTQPSEDHPATRAASAASTTGLTGVDNGWKLVADVFASHPVDETRSFQAKWSHVRLKWAVGKLNDSLEALYTEANAGMNPSLTVAISTGDIAGLAVPYRISINGTSGSGSVDLLGGRSPSNPIAYVMRVKTSDSLPTFEVLVEERP